ncbi:MAG: DMT family transporter [Casimicrobiaceae bacterium]
MPPSRLSSSRSAGLLCLIVTAVGWGVNWPAMKFLLREWPPLFARGVAGVTAALLLALLARSLGQSLAVPRALLGRLALGGLLNVFAWMGFSTLSMLWLAAGQGALLVYTMPIWAMLLTWPLLGKRPQARGVVGLALCAVGLGLLFGGHDLAIGAAQLPGVLFALAAAVSFALGTVMLAPLALPPLTLLVWQLVIGCVPMIAFGVVDEKPDLGGLSPLGWGLLAYMTLVPMGLCYLTWFAALRRLPPALAAVGTLLTPVVGVVSAAWVLGEPLGIREAVAMVLTISGVALALRRA